MNPWTSSYTRVLVPALRVSLSWVLGTRDRVMRSYQTIRVTLLLDMVLAMMPGIIPSAYYSDLLGL